MTLSFTIDRTFFDRADPRLGRHINHDSRSRAYAFKAPAGVTYKSVLFDRHIPILDQGDLGSCTGNAATGHLGSGAFYATVAGTSYSGDEAEAVKLYSSATSLDAYSGTYPPTDTGSDGLSVAKAAQKAGLISGYQHTFTFDDFMAALQQQPVIVGVTWYNNFFTPDANGLITMAAGDTVAGGHEFVIRGYDADKQQVIADNSWGTSWGVAGSFRISNATMQRLLSSSLGGDCTMFTPITAPAPTPTPVPVPTPTPVPPGPDDPTSDEIQTLADSTRKFRNSRLNGGSQQAKDALNVFFSDLGVS
jgi:hypothetical protein